MWWKSKACVGIAAIALLVAVGAVLLGTFSSSTAQAAQRCVAEYENETQRIDCWYDIIRNTFDTSGTEAAFSVFSDIYEAHDTFARTGCHRHAHRVGDLAYYFDYLSHKDVEQVAFPRNASACGYGFYHGFIEHLIQNRSEQEFVDATCAYLTESLIDVAPAIEQTCYHGAGHGFVLAIADKLTDPKDWNAEAFVAEPLRQCEALQGANEKSTSECRQGVFNVLVDWMATGEYELSYNYDDPFAVCRSQETTHHRDCYYEMSQKLDIIDGKKNPAAVEILLADTADPLLRDTVMSVAVAGMVQHDPKGSQIPLLLRCREITDQRLRDMCVRSIVGGLFEHGAPQREHEGGTQFCTDEALQVHEKEQCFQEYETKLKRFNTPAEIQNLCDVQQMPQEVCDRIAQINL